MALLLVLFALFSSVASASGQVTARVPNPCDEPTYRQLLLKSNETLTTGERAYLTQESFACAEYLKAVDALRGYVIDRPPLKFYKDPDLALALSVPVPGGGHIYAGEPATGFALLLAAVGAPLLGLVLADCNTPTDGIMHCDAAPVAIGAVAGAAAWLWGIIDAPSAARRANARQ